MRHGFERTVLVALSSSFAAALRMMVAQARWPVRAVRVASFLCASLRRSARCAALDPLRLTPACPTCDRLTDMLS